jgi:hypothetical protein
MASSQGGVRPSPMAYPAVRAAAKTPARYRSTYTTRHEPYLLVRLLVRPERHRAQSCAIALRSPADPNQQNIHQFRRSVPTPAGRKRRRGLRAGPKRAGTDMRRSLLAACLPLVVRKRLAATVTVCGCGGDGGGDGDAAAAERHAQPMCTSLATLFIFTLPFMLVTHIGLLAAPCVATVGWVRCAHPPIPFFGPPTPAPLLVPTPLPVGGCADADAMRASLARHSSGSRRSVTSSRSPSVRARGSYPTHSTAASIRADRATAMRRRRGFAPPRA